MEKHYNSAPVLTSKNGKHYYICLVLRWTPASNLLYIPITQGESIRILTHYNLNFMVLSVIKDRNNITFIFSAVNYKLLNTF